MIMKRIILVCMLLSASFALYNVGETVSISDQNIVLEGCDTTSDYYQQEFKLADWNGDLNGGNYKVIWLELSSSW